MAKRFNLSSESLLARHSGIVHDPIQLMTPLFFGAQLLITAKEDIQQQQLNKSAVSYFEITSATEDPNAFDELGDTIPAGWGMQDVQILVISREDNTKICGKSAEKFVDNRLVDNAKWVEADKANDKGEP
ncbi:large subunit of alpha-aminoadipate reductase [Fusarium piperis]|uniref:Large subunit of alpha-aminoadipate reductase n=1 Tax=Fusarium piperis TaxID=1435070 RepID=A0A9W9BK27_9HYPO|nr:large subunit of alpha-aminoadipate reductase [Fusarium piperis]